MAASGEWEEVHLTPSGRMGGRYKHDLGKQVGEPIPSDALLSIRRHVCVGAIGATASVNEAEKLRTDDKAKVAEQARSGKPTFGV